MFWPRSETVAMGFFVTLCAACGSDDQDSERAAQRPNIVLVSIDSLRPDHLACYGYARPTSPTIDKLAAEGVRFETAVSTTSWTLPAHAALFTGLTNQVHGVVFDGLCIGEKERSLAEVLGEAGYQTAGFFGGPYLHPRFGMAQGFQHYESCMTPHPDANPELAAASAGALDNEAQRDITGPRTVEAIARWAESTPRSPYFLFVHLFDVHYDYIPPAEFARMFDPDYHGAIDGTGVSTNPEIRPAMDPRDLAHLIALYDGEVRFTDDTLARILEVLRARRLLENTLVVITADHGEQFFEHGSMGHRISLFDEELRIPLVFHWPGH